MDIREQIATWQDKLATFRWDAQTLSIVALLSIAIVAIAFLQQPFAPPEQDDLFTRRLTPTQLQRVEAALGKAELTQYSIQNGIIRVPRDQRAKYFAALQDADSLPRSFQGPNSPTSLALKATSTFESPRTTQQRMHHALEQKARLAICELSGIQDAFVFFDEKTDRSLQQKKTVTAVVGVRTTQPLDLQTYQVIRDMLLGFKVDLTPADITITDLTSVSAVRGSLDEAESAEVQTLARQSLERQWKQKVEGALAFVQDAVVNIRVVPKSIGMEAQSVRVSVGIPSTYMEQFSNVSDLDQAISQTRQKIQSTLRPLLPETESPVEELVVVNVFDVAEQPLVAATSVISRVFPWFLIVACLSSIALLVLLVGGGRTPPAKPQLRVYGGAEGGATTPEESQPVGETNREAKLRAYVAENPSAAAKSLSDFIDRAS